RRRLIGEGVELARLADVPVLAELAGQVAAGGPERQQRGARQEVVQRLLLDRIDTEPARPPPGGEHDPVVLASPHEAEPPLPFEQLAEPRAEVALDPPVVERVPVLRGNRAGGDGCVLHDGENKGKEGGIPRGSLPSSAVTVSSVQVALRRRADHSPEISSEPLCSSSAPL